MSYSKDVSIAAQSGLPWIELSGCNVLVTGATGLIGSCLVDVLMAHPGIDYTVYAACRNIDKARQMFQAYLDGGHFRLMRYDVEEPMESGIQFHYIIHAASYAGPDAFQNSPVEVIKANIIGTSNLLDYGRTHGLRRFLFLSSGEVYGQGDGRVFTEDYMGYVDPILPRSCYPSSKRAGETLCVSYAQEYGVDCVIARPCHVFGPGFSERDARVYAQFIRNVLRGEDICIKSDGSQSRSWCYVVDCADAIMHVLLKGETSQAYNIADPSSVLTIRELAEIIARTSGRKVVFDQPDKAEAAVFNPVRQSVFSTGKIESLGWTVTGNVESKLRSTVEDYLLRHQ